MGCEPREPIVETSSPMNEIEERRSYLEGDERGILNDAGENEINELIEIIYINKILTDRKQDYQFNKLIESIENNIELNLQKFYSAEEEYGVLSDEIIYVLDEIVYGDISIQQSLESSIAYSLASLYDSEVSPKNLDTLNYYINLVELYFKYFMTYYHYNMFHGNSVFQNKLDNLSNEIALLTEQELLPTINN